MTQEKEKVSIPPYVPYKTFKNFLDGLNPVPSVIDGHVLKTMGGALRSQLLSSLRYLKLLDSNNRTQPALKTLAALKGDDRKKELAKLITNSYPFLFENSGDFSLTEGTYPLFLGKFQDEGATGETAKRCARFFLDVAKDAGIVVSPYIQSEPITKTKSDGGGKTSRPRGVSKPKGGQEANTGNGYTPPPSLSKWETHLKSAYDLLPTNFDKDGKAHWKKSDRDRFLVLLTAIVDAFAIADGKE